MRGSEQSYILYNRQTPVSKHDSQHKGSINEPVVLREDVCEQDLIKYLLIG